MASTARAKANLDVSLGPIPLGPIQVAKDGAGSPKSVTRWNEGLVQRRGPWWKLLLRLDRIGTAMANWAGIIPKN